MSWPPGAEPASTIGSRFARAAYTAAGRPPGPEPTMMSLEWVGPRPSRDVAGPPGAVATSGARAIESPPRGAGVAGAATDVSPEKSMESPPNGAGLVLRPVIRRHRITGTIPLGGMY